MHNNNYDNIYYFNTKQLVSVQCIYCAECKTPKLPAEGNREEVSSDIIAGVAELAGTGKHVEGGTLEVGLVRKGPLPLPVGERTEMMAE